MKPTYLYVKQHKLTGAKYFGKTTKNNPIEYMGSGIHWKLHIKKYGTEHVETLWYELFTDKQELVEYALKFSVENNIVNSKEWLNLKEENGLDGGMEKGFWSKEQIENFRSKQKERWAKGLVDPEKLRLNRIGFKQPQSQKDSVSKALSKNWSITNPTGNNFIITNLRKFCLENGLDQGNMSRGKYKGWKCIKINT
jgi:hypothetical protein